MPISLNCDCGRALRVKDELAGRRVRCPVCQAVLTVPEPVQPAEEGEAVRVNRAAPRTSAAGNRDFNFDSDSASPPVRRKVSTDADPNDDAAAKPIVRRKAPDSELDEEDSSEPIVRTACLRHQGRRVLENADGENPAMGSSLEKAGLAA